MSDINEVRERLERACVAGMDAEYVDDVSTLLADHVFLQQAHCAALKGMRQAVVALAYAQQNDPIYLQAYGLLGAAIKQAKAVQP